MMVPTAWTYLVTLYTDLNYFYVRKLNSNVDQFATNFSNPMKIDTPGTGFQCACFNSDETIIYTLDKDSNLVQNTIGSSSVTTISRIS